jgi:uncharacterized protein involved in exopolysaccharide biosynthesis/Mrp family chromosome partitioning ATPase
MTNETALPQILDILRRRRALILTMGFAGAALAGLAGILLPPRYTAMAEIVVDPKPPVPSAGQVLVAATPMSESTVQTYVTALTSRERVQRVIDSLEQDKRGAQASHKTAQPSELVLIRDWLLERLRQWWAAVAQPVTSFVAQFADQNDDTPAAKQILKPDVEAFKRRLVVFQERGSHVLAVTFTSTNAVDAARIANRVVDVYLQDSYDQERDNTNRTLAWVNKRIPELKAKLDGAEAAVQDYRAKHGLVQGSKGDLMTQKLADLNRQLTEAGSALAERQAKLDTFEQLRHSGASQDAIAQAMDTDSLRQLRAQEVTLLQNRAQLAATMGEMNPQVRAVAAQLREVRSRIAHEVDRGASDLARDVNIAKAQVASLQARLAAAQRESSEGEAPAARLRDLERSATTIRQVYEDFLQRREQLRDHQETISPDVRILSRAVPPNRPSSPNPLLFPLPAFIAFAVAGALIAVGRERLDQGLRSIRDVNDALTIPCIGLIPQIRRQGRRRPHQHLLAKPFGPYAEAIRSVAASLPLAGSRGIPEAVLITSSVPQEGKTTLAVSLAVYAASLGRRTVLVDLDFRRPAIWREIGGNDATSTLELLDNDGRSSVTLLSVPGLGLHVLAMRRRPNDPLAAFASGQLAYMLDHLRSNYDCIIIDSPPLLAVAETRLLATLADKILFVVKWGSTRRAVARNALELLRDTRILGAACNSIVSAVITQVDVRRHAKYRYGDAVESYVRYAQYYLKNPPPIGGQNGPTQRLGSGDLTKRSAASQ